MIGPFVGKYRFLSNFYPALVRMPDGVTYPSVEHAYQAHKTENLITRKDIASLATAGEAKRMGRSLKLRQDWEKVKLSVMEQALFNKFSGHVILEIALLGTGDAELVEINTWGDTYWGVCNGKGQNHLGKLLMRVRQILKEARQ